MTTLLADPRVAAVPVHDNGEPLVRLDWIAGAAAGAARFVRSGLAERLAVAQDLLPKGLHVLLSEGYRTEHDQLTIEHAYAASLRAEYGDLEDDALRRLTSRYVAPLAVAPHVAGAAVDVTLVDGCGHELWMGTPIDATPEESDGACFFAATNIDGQARRNRTVLAEALLAAGLVNYPTEWWHWSFGDRYWALVTGTDAALYGPVSA